MTAKWNYQFLEHTIQDAILTCARKHRYTHPFNGPFSGTTQVSWYQKGKTNLDFTEARDSEWQWHQLGHMQVCVSLQTDNHASTPPLKFFLLAGCPSCHPANSVKALKALLEHRYVSVYDSLKLQCFDAVGWASGRVNMISCWLSCCLWMCCCQVF